MIPQFSRILVLTAAVGVVGWFTPDSRISSEESRDRKRKGRNILFGDSPIIREVKPLSARVGEKIKIEGENFGPEMPVVTFNGVTAVMKEAEIDELRVFVPRGATTGPLVVTVGSRKSKSVQFVVELSDGISPVSVASAAMPLEVKSDPALAAQPSPSLTVFFAKDVQPIFDNHCTTCHGGSAGLFLDAGESYANLVNVQATKGCMSEKRVLPGNPSVSVLYKRITGTSCGTQMPKKAPPLTAEEIGTIKKWIDQGALDN